MDERPAEKTEQGSDQSGRSSSILAEGKANEDVSENKQQKEIRAHNHAAQTMAKYTLGPIKKVWGYIRSTEFTNLALALATIAIAVFTWLTYEVVQSSSQDTKRLISAAETQADAADQISDAADDFTDSAKWMEVHTEDAAKAMQDSVNTASRNTETTIRNAQTAFRDEQRAWVGVQDVVGVDFNETKPWTVRVIFFNSGRSPARSVQISAMFKTSNTPISGPSAEDIKQLQFRPSQSIAPQGKYNTTFGSAPAGEPFTTAQIQGSQVIVSNYQDIKKGSLILYYFGILKYDDGFGKQRSTQYCIFLANTETKEAGFCDTFNDLN